MALIITLSQLQNFNTISKYKELKKSYLPFPAWNSQQNLKPVAIFFEKNTEPNI